MTTAPGSAVEGEATFEVVLEEECSASLKLAPLDGRLLGVSMSTSTSLRFLGEFWGVDRGVNGLDDRPPICKGSGLDGSCLGVEGKASDPDIASRFVFGNSFTLSAKKLSKKREDSVGPPLRPSGSCWTRFILLPFGDPKAFASDDEDEEKVTGAGGGVGYAL